MTNIPVNNVNDYFLDATTYRPGDVIANFDVSYNTPLYDTEFLWKKGNERSWISKFSHCLVIARVKARHDEDGNSSFWSLYILTQDGNLGWIYES